MAKKKAAPKPAEEPPAEEQPTPPAEENNRCFIITPIGDENSEVRRATDGLVDAVIQPVLGRFDLEVEVAHRNFDQRSITRRIIEHVVESRLVIANLTGLNPNVMYELAVRHSAAKPVVTIAERGTRLPFDLRDELAFFYSDDMRGVVELCDTLTAAIARSLSADSFDNPITRYTDTALIDLKGDPPDAMELILDRLDSLERSVTRPKGHVRAFAGQRDLPLFSRDGVLVAFRVSGPGVGELVVARNKDLRDAFWEHAIDVESLLRRDPDAFNMLVRVPSRKDLARVRYRIRQAISSQGPSFNAIEVRPEQPED